MRYLLDDDDVLVHERELKRFQLKLWFKKKRVEREVVYKVEGERESKREIEREVLYI